MKKLFSLTLCAAMIVTMIGCSSASNETVGNESDIVEVQDGTTTQEGEEITESGSESAIDFEEEPYLLNICYAVAGEAQPDLALIQEKLNEITLREINAQVELEAVSLFSMANVYALKASSQEKMDLMLMFPGYNYLASFANSNMLMPIEAYVDEWGADIKEVTGEIFKAGEFNGHLYAVAQNKEIRANALGFNVSLELCEKYDINPDDIKSTLGNP